jgi:DNA helicase HerA-like ATPase
MRILSKNSDGFLMLAMKTEIVSKGEYLLIQDENLGRRLIVQVFDEEYLSSQPLIDDMIRDEIAAASSVERIHDPLNISRISNLLRDARIYHTKIRASVDGSGMLTTEISGLPSRVCSKVRLLKISELHSFLGRTGKFLIPLGKAGMANENIAIYAEDLDGKLNIITGRKESGKSHLSKMLVKTLLEHGGYIFVFDLNNEYQGLAYNRDKSPSNISNRVIRLEIDDALSFSLDYCGKTGISNMLKNALEMPAASLREFMRIWDHLESKKSLNLTSIEKAINTWNINEFVREALISRFHTVQTSKLFSEDGSRDSFRFEEIISRMTTGAAFIVSMAKIRPIVRLMLVELILSKLVELLERAQIPPVFLFAEEAHMYVRDTYWEDIITRMRHFGIYATFITNQPDAINDGIYRQVDNIFLFNFTNDSDLDKISKVSLADRDTIRSIVKTLPQRCCLAIGKAMCDLPVVVRVAALELLVLGETKKFFQT